MVVFDSKRYTKGVKRGGGTIPHPDLKSSGIYALPAW